MRLENEWMLQGGWMPWDICSPCVRNEPVQIMRDEWDSPQTLTRNEMSPHMNTIGLYWRKTALYRMAEAQMPHEGFQQLNALYGSANMGWFTRALRGSL